MDLLLNINIPKPDKNITHRHGVLSIGSCFTEHIGTALKELKFGVLQNPHGILFDPLAVANALSSYLENKRYAPEDLFQLNEVWHSWDHHSRFSHTDAREALAGMNTSQQEAHQFLQKADWLIITLGSAFSYKLTAQEGRAVANCHRAPGQWFTKHLSAVEEMVTNLQNVLTRLFRFNPDLAVIFTVSPVRHIRDGVVDNNRSKARLLETVHQLVDAFENVYYFPSYELVIDVLRDYRFYAEDMVHPNYLATNFVLEKFMQTFMEAKTMALVKEIKEINIARNHRPAHPGTEAHKKFLRVYRDKVNALQEKHPYLNLQQEVAYFDGV